MKIILEGHDELEYHLRQSNVSKRLRLVVSADGRLWVSAPKRTSIRFIERFMHDQTQWILRNIAAVHSRPKTIFTQQHSPREIASYKKQARALVHQRIAALNAAYGYRYGSVALRNQKSRWGSCSKKGNLNFNYRIVLLPPEHADYIIVHELCHLKEFNHSRRFWDLVAIASPNHKRLRTELRHLEIMG